MKFVEIKGESYQKFSKAVFLADNGSSNLSALKNWEQPLNFRPNSNNLKQYQGGPCGLFAVLQAHIVIKENDNNFQNASQEHILISLILDIFSRISSYYVFCDGFDAKTEYAHFQYTTDLDEAYSFILGTDYIKSYNACLLLTLSIVFASIGMSDLNVPAEPYIYGDRNTTMALVWLMLNGSTNDANLAQTENSNYRGTTQTQIGIKVLNNPDKRVVGTWLNPNANVFVCHRGCHFFVVLTIADIFIVYDSLNDKSPFETTKKSLQWS
ncbi:hypothetical protein TRFO_34965 [Tritrichomonas foetus]|uniref:Deubiquitinating enzyme MINDY-3/4 conserved domain-containing protein n=1 Tax=Tritrichomonas foetus TaxID=1144522 RepID=A0A1J4JHL6_9EUKA|nr:hypothetical protein TRFO_34965 [Tritrichomonas foetus]|eukprot:OHS98630.1 hypothetical protein TRFO_34965 [Tritrichomonas foetus]